METETSPFLSSVGSDSPVPSCLLRPEGLALIKSISQHLCGAAVPHPWWPHLQWLIAHWPWEVFISSAEHLYVPVDRNYRNRWKIWLQECVCYHWKCSFSFQLDSPSMGVDWAEQSLPDDSQTPREDSHIRQPLRSHFPPVAWALRPSASYGDFVLPSTRRGMSFLFLVSVWHVLKWHQAGAQNSVTEWQMARGAWESHWCPAFAETFHCSGLRWGRKSVHYVAAHIL